MSPHSFPHDTVRQRAGGMRQAARWWDARMSPAPSPQLGRVPRTGGGAAGPGGPRARRTARRSRDEASHDQRGPGCREEKVLVGPGSEDESCSVPPS